MTLHVLSIDQPYASLIMAGVKTAETRKGPPSGDMRPAGVRGIPGHKINRGDRIGIASTVRRLRDYQEIAGGWAREMSDHSFRWVTEPDPAKFRGTLRVPLGHLLGTVRVDGALPILRTGSPPLPSGSIARPFGPPSHIKLGHWSNFDGGRWSVADMTDQLPYGFWDAGNWALMLSDPQPTTDRCPGPCEGRGTVPTTGQGPDGYDRCWVCAGDGHCPPISLAGLPGTRQECWGWTP